MGLPTIIMLGNITIDRNGPYKDNLTQEVLQVGCNKSLQP